MTIEELTKPGLIGAALLSACVTVLAQAGVRFDPGQGGLSGWIGLVSFIVSFPGDALVALMSSIFLSGRIHSMGRLIWLSPILNFLFYCLLFVVLIGKMKRSARKPVDWG